jgi:hypothetical protein
MSGNQGAACKRPEKDLNHLDSVLLFLNDLQTEVAKKNKQPSGSREALQPEIRRPQGSEKPASQGL